MKIAIITSVHLPLDGRIFYKQATSLTQAGHQVTLLAPDAPSATETVEQAGITYLPLTGSHGRGSRPRRWWQIAGMLRHSQYDAWHFHDPELLPLTIIWKFLFAPNVLLVYDVHEDVPKDIMDKAWIPKKLRRPLAKIIDRVERWGMRRCDLVVAATDSIGERVKKFSRRSVIVRNYPLSRYIGAKSSRRLSSDGTVRIIYCGNLTEPRGIREIVEAVNLLSEHKVKLTLLGQLYPQEFAQEISRIAGSQIEVLAKVPFDQVPHYLEESDIGIVCFQPTPNHLEAMPNKLFEYMEAHLPVIASDFPLWKAIIEGAGCGLLVNPTDIQQISQAIVFLASEPELRLKMGNAGAEAVLNTYSWNRESRTLLDAYQELSSSSYE